VGILGDFGDFSALSMDIDRHVCFLAALWWLVGGFGSVVRQKRKERFFLHLELVIRNICKNGKSIINGEVHAYYILKRAVHKLFPKRALHNLFSKRAVCNHSRIPIREHIL